MTTATQSIETLAINTIRTLSMDGVQKANSGHPGTPMALAPVAYALWNNHLNYDPVHPRWPGRDRFILSCGHASMLLYSTLHLAGVRKEDGGSALSITLDDIKNFRQLHSPCAGHPEYGDAAGIETTTGPLGQGIGMSVGMAAAAKWLAAHYDKPDFELFGFNVFAICSDGDIMEGIGCEAASLAGHMQLDNLCWIYDDNHITIEGHTDLAFTECVATRFQGLGWHTIRVADANDVDALNAAIEEFKQTTDKPTLILVRSIIGWGAPTKADSHEAHGSPLGEEEIKATKAFYGWNPEEKFVVPADVPQHFAENLGQRGAAAYRAWSAKFAKYEQAHAASAAEVKLIFAKKLPSGWDVEIPTFAADAKGIATRASSGQVLNAIAKKVPWLLGGSADLAPSNNTHLKGEQDFEPGSFGGRNFHFGIREHSMAAASNGMALVGLRPFCGTFFIFTDYLRPSLRLSAIMRQPVLYILTHDSIGLGEDGTTHQPVEHLAACRAIPRLIVMRPGDANEVAEAYRVILPLNHRPVALILSRQNMPTLDRTKYASAAGVARGAYVVADAKDGKPNVILIGTGSELSLAVEAYEKLSASGVKARVVSMPSWELFDDQDQKYRDSVLPPNVKARVAVEAGLRLGWDKYIGTEGGFVGMTGFGLSAPAGTLFKHFGITADRVVEEAKKLI